MTQNLRIFTLFSLIWSLSFFATLNWCLENTSTRGPLILLASLIFGVGFSIAGSQLGKHEQKRVSYPLGLRYGLVAGIVPSIVGSIWVLGWQSDKLGYLAAYIGAILLSFAIYIAIGKKTIKGITKKELFK
jgi:FtsH-binding integral membrane protein